MDTAVTRCTVNWLVLLGQCKLVLHITHWVLHTTAHSQPIGSCDNQDRVLEEVYNKEKCEVLRFYASRRDTKKEIRKTGKGKGWGKKKREKEIPFEC
eukprot:SAG11_NODE_17860_length_507_cov_0.806373_1_plen_97_part_00